MKQNNFEKRLFLHFKFFEILGIKTVDQFNFWQELGNYGHTSKTT